MLQPVERERLVLENNFFHIIQDYLYKTVLSNMVYPNMVYPLKILGSGQNFEQTCSIM